ncbi:hypothetical protein ES705_45571 [subsurface metagenome]
MFRGTLNDLISWKHSDTRKPLIIRGARQVGKTWLIKEFGKTQYPKYAVRTSMSDYREEDWLINIPLYAISHVIAILETGQGRRNVY